MEPPVWEHELSDLINIFSSHHDLSIEDVLTYMTYVICRKMADMDCDDDEFKRLTDGMYLSFKSMNRSDSA